MTPRQVAALRIRQKQSLQHLEILAGIIASTTANFSFCKPDKAMSPNDFMLHKLPPEPEREVTFMDFRNAFSGRLITQ